MSGQSAQLKSGGSDSDPIDSDGLLDSGSGGGVELGEAQVVVAAQVNGLGGGACESRRGVVREEREAEAPTERSSCGQG